MLQKRKRKGAVRNAKKERKKKKQPHSFRPVRVELASLGV
jgi:ribosomal 50S subunit-associated protein YjgA (DUF615 family)